MPKSAKKIVQSPVVEYFQYFALAFITIISFGLVFSNITKVSGKNVVLGATDEYLIPDIKDLEKEREYWVKIIEGNHTYRDGYIELADIDYRLGDLETARKWLEKAKELDPNSDFIPGLERLLQ
jgi:tetratricopeptide (TPR) repeat protein